MSGESSYIRERARELGMNLRELADRVGVSYGYMSMVARGHSNMGVKVQARVASALEAPAKVAPAQPACIDREAMWERMNAHGFSQNEAARRAGISSAHLSQIMNGRNSPSAVVLRKLHGVLFLPTKAERVMPAEVKVLGWRKGERHGMVVHGAGGPGRRGRSGGPAIRVGGHVPWGAKAEFAYRAGYDGTGRLSVTHVVERGYSAMLKRPELGRRLETHGRGRRRCGSGLSRLSVYAVLFCCPKSPPVFDITEVGAAGSHVRGSHVRAAALPRRLPLARASLRPQRLAGQPPCRPRRAVARLDADDGLKVLDRALEPGHVHAGDAPAVEDGRVPGVEVEDPAVVLYRQLVLLQAGVGQPLGREGLGVAGVELQGPVEVLTASS